MGSGAGSRSWSSRRRAPDAALGGLFIRSFFSFFLCFLIVFSFYFEWHPVAVALLFCPFLRPVPTLIPSLGACRRLWLLPHRHDLPLFPRCCCWSADHPIINLPFSSPRSLLFSSLCSPPSVALVIVPHHASFPPRSRRPAPHLLTPLPLPLSLPPPLVEPLCPNSHSLITIPFCTRTYYVPGRLSRPRSCRTRRHLCTVIICAEGPGALSRMLRWASPAAVCTLPPEVLPRLEGRPRCPCMHTYIHTYIREEGRLCIY